MKKHLIFCSGSYIIIEHLIADTESCPSWSKEHDWKSCNGLSPVRGFESLALRHEKALKHKA